MSYLHRFKIFSQKGIDIASAISKVWKVLMHHINMQLVVQKKANPQNLFEICVLETEMSQAVRMDVI